MTISPLTARRLLNISASLLIFCLGFFLFSYFRGFDPDLWGHIKFGEVIWSTGQIPQTDFFSFSPVKPLWVNHELLSEIVFYLVFKLHSGGFYLLFLKAVICTVALVIPFLYNIRNNRNIIFKTLLFLVILMAFTYGTAIRPQIFTYLFFSLTLLTLRTEFKKPVLSTLILFLIFLIWVNTHGGIAAGLGITYIFYLCKSINVYLKEKSFKKVFLNHHLVFPPIILTFTLFLTPYGVHYIPYLFDAVLLNRTFVEEWGSVFAVKANFTFFFILSALFLAVFVATFKHITSRNIHIYLILGLTCLMSFKHARHIPLFCVAAAYYMPVLIDLVHIKTLTIKESVDKAIAMSLAAVFLGFSVLSLYATLVKEGQLDYGLNVNLLSTNRATGYPIQTVQYINQHNISGNMMTPFNWGEFIIFSLYPKVKVSFDGRYETVYPDFVVQDNLNFFKAAEGWEQTLKKYNADLILAPKGSPIVPKLKALSGWKLVFEDYEALLFKKTS